MSNDVKTKNDEEIRLFFSAGDRMMKGIDALRKKNRPLLGGHRYLTDGELSRLLHINRRTLQAVSYTHLICPNTTLSIRRLRVLSN